jgi:NTE family protein
MRVGLVLGAGGIVGQAYHAGVLAALETDLGWDPRSADVIVGSSAGSVTGSALRLGAPALDLAAYTVDAPLSAEAASLFETLGAPPTLPPFEARSLLRPWRMPSRALLARTARRPWALRGGAPAATLLPAGTVDLLDHAVVLDELCDGDLPDGLWLCAARRDDGGRVVFGRPGAPRPRLSEAVAASCAIPGYSCPVQVGGTEYVDGGVHSPTNADVLRHEALDLVIAISPMSAARGLARTPDALVRRAAHRRLELETRRLRAGGTEVVRIEPGPRVLAAMGINAMADDRSDRVVRAAFLDAGGYLATGRVARRLAGLGTRTRHLTAA